MEQRADLFCVFLILIFPSLWTRLENWFPSLRRFCLHTKRTETSPPDVLQSRGTSSRATVLWSQSKETETDLDAMLRNFYGSWVLREDSMPSPYPAQSVETTLPSSQDSGTRPDLSNPLTGITYVACPCNWCTAWNQRVRERESGRGGRRSFS